MKKFFYKFQSTSKQLFRTIVFKQNVSPLLASTFRLSFSSSFEAASASSVFPFCDGLTPLSEALFSVSVKAESEPAMTQRNADELSERS